MASEVICEMTKRRPAENKDKYYLWQLFKSAYEEVVIRQFGHWDEDLYSKYFEDSWPGNNYEILLEGDEKIGALWLVDEADYIWLREIQISPEHQGKGLGSRLLGEVLAEADQAGKPVRLRVLKASRALTLYDRIGFRATGEHNGTHLWMSRAPAQAD